MPRSTAANGEVSSTSRAAWTQPLVLALLLVRSPSPLAPTLALANSAPAVFAVARTVRRRVAPDGISAMLQTTDEALTTQLPPGSVALLTGWLRFNDKVALLTAIARSELTSANTSSGAPTSTSAALADRANRASIPERSVTCSWRLLFDVSRSLPAVTAA